ncbi:GCN5 family acetyltransferase [Paenibacillus swuensis]|uniref:GCN5 family acetyltransferase n=2 Tax=Paenibacillus swuensis TaxID=1178515 RepID=A0A172TP39_9BACL|nr:GCN5 family acetyltransferase [Paenibacillus swuensis]
MLNTEFAKYYPWFTQSRYHESCLEENQNGTRVTLLAYYDGILAGCCHLLYISKYPHFVSREIPEINDLNVFPQYRNKRIASALFDRLEGIAAENSSYVGLGVGLYKDYGNAQRMYGQRGYVLDGEGLMYGNNAVRPGETVRVDDELLLYLIKQLI